MTLAGSRATAHADGPPEWWRPLVWPKWSLALEPVRATDAYAILRAVTDEIAVGVGLANADAMRAQTPSWAQEAEEFASRRFGYKYLVVHEGRMAGAIEIRRDPTRGHVGYWLRRPERGKGTITRSLQIILLVGFQGMRLRAIDLIADAGNAASIAVMERVGARLRGTFSSRLDPDREESSYRVLRSSFKMPSGGPPRLADLYRKSDNNPWTPR